MERELSWDELPDRLAQLAGLKPLPDGRTLHLLSSSQTLEHGSLTPRYLASAVDEINRLAIRTVKDRLLVSVCSTTFIVVRADFRQAVEGQMPQGHDVYVRIRYAPDLTLDLQFEHYDSPYAAG